MKRLASVLTIFLVIIFSSWVFAQNNTLSYLRGIAHSDSGLYSAVGDAGLIITSEDGVSWSKVALPVAERVNGVVWAMEKFVAVGDKGTILTSADGKEWTKVDISGKEMDFNSVASSGNEFIAVGDEGTILVSKDGTLWEQRRMATKEKIYRVRWIKDRYFAVGEPMLILTSMDGITWDEVKADPASAMLFTDIAWNGDKYIIVGDQSNIWVSENGQEWKQNEAIPIKEEMYPQCICSVAWTGNKFVAVGDGGRVLTSSDGADWKEEDYSTNKDLLDIVYSNGKFVAVGEKGIILTSGDGVKWDNHYSISVQSNNITLKLGQQKKLSIMLNYPYGETEDITDETLFEVVEGLDVISVEKNGEVKAIGVGKAIVKATYDTESIEISVNVEKDSGMQSENDGQDGEKENSKEKVVKEFLNVFLAVATILIVMAMSFVLSKKQRD